MLLILLAIVIWLPAVIGFGTVPLRIIRKFSSSESLPMVCYFVSGLAVLGSIANVTNFFAPLTPVSGLVLAIVGWVLLAVNSRYVLLSQKYSVPSIVFALLTVAGIAWLVPQDAFGVYDGGLYHVQSIKWLSESVVPLGLGNLHGRLAFNSSWFSIAAILELPFLPYPEYLVLNAVFLSAYGLSLGYVLSRLILGEETSFSQVFFVSTGIVWYHLVAQGAYLGSSSPVGAGTLIILLLVFLTIRGVESESPAWGYYTVLSCFLACFAATIQLSALPVLLAPAILFFWGFGRHHIHPLLHKPALGKVLAGIAVSALVVILPWAARGIALSGCIAYPVSQTCLPTLKWSVPLTQVNLEAAWIRSWARIPHQNPETVLRDWHWLGAWGKSFVRSGVVVMVACLSICGAILNYLAGTVKLQYRDDSQISILPAITLPAIIPIVGILYWFLTAPDLRFGAGYFWALGLLGLCAGAYRFCRINLTRNHHSVTQKAMLIGSNALIAGLVLITVMQDTNPGVLGRENLLSAVGRTVLTLRPFPAVETRSISQSGITLLAPVKGDQCWDSDLPCTPYPTDGLGIATRENGMPLMFYAADSE